MVIYELSLTTEYHPRIVRVVQTRKYPRNGQPGVSPQCLTGVSRSDRRQECRNESTTKTCRLEVL